ncbi:hypothetical protein [Legionella gresilensis]|uniref:hypothetical protein n=1 Tax=Legionella gresilensis TaxID=91823 RepID=UPI0010417485|nr:hypothetical protein [Legionella gresilensis]
MPLSPTFIKLFSELNTDYQQKGKGGLLSYGKDSHFDNLKINIESIFTSIEHSNKDDSSFDDMSLLSVLSITATRFSTTDPIFASLVSSLIDKYYKSFNYNNYLTEQGMLIKVNPEARYSINALSELQRAFGNLQNAHQSEKTMLLDQIQDLQKEKNLLKDQNNHLREQVSKLESSKKQWEKLSSAIPIIEKIKGDLASLNSLVEPTSPTPDIPSPQEMKREEQYSLVHPSNLPNNDTLELNSSSVKMIESLIPPPPEPPETSKAKQKDHTKLTTTKDTLELKKPSKPAPRLTFQADLANAIKKREENKKNQQHTSPRQEKKNIQAI